MNTTARMAVVVIAFAGIIALAPAQPQQVQQPVITVNQTQPATWTVTYQGRTATVASEIQAEQAACNFSGFACHGSMQPQN
jgi:hypothetical protein